MVSYTDLLERFKLLCTVGHPQEVLISCVSFGVHPAASFSLKGCVTDVYENQLRSLLRGEAGRVS